MSALAWAFVAYGVFGVVVGFLAVVLVVGGRRKPTPQPPRLTVRVIDHGDHVHIVTEVPGPILDAAIKRQTARLRAELEDPATVEQWLRGGRS